MSEEESQNTQRPNHRLGISPDPKINISTSGTDTDTVTVQRTETNWQYSTDGENFQPYSGEILIQSRGDEPAPDGFLRKLTVTVEQTSGLPYTNAELTQQGALVDNQAPFDVGADRGDVFEVRLVEVERNSAPAIVNQSYYIRSAQTYATGDPDNPVACYFAYFYWPNPGDGQPLANYEGYDSSDDVAYRWILIRCKSPSPDYPDNYYTIQSATGYSPPNFTQSPASLNVVLSTQEAYDGIVMGLWVLQETPDGPFSGGISSQQGYWTANNPNLPSTIYLGPSGSTQETLWNIIPAELGPHWTGIGVLGPKVSTISNVNDQLIVHYSTYTVTENGSVLVYNNSGYTVTYSGGSSGDSGTIDDGGSRSLSADTYSITASGDGAPSNTATLTIVNH